MAKVKSKHQGVNGVYYIVNPAGAVHSCDRDHAKGRLGQAGWRLAEDPEIEVYVEQKVQRHKSPICEPWTPEPEIGADIPDADGDGAPEATDEAVKLASEHGLDLAAVKGSGAGGRILVKDVEAAIGAKPAQ
ncbi:MAG TPA: E3 binding domain-containing protein [Anaerolineae bacterium]|jgi:pyruvate/2-oxoglutarate dehydrogenase complex dihydrolipoamide acyltransferase (E2) component